jgi:hypothetical protein
MDWALNYETENHGTPGTILIVWEAKCGALSRVMDWAVTLSVDSASLYMTRPVERRKSL